MSGATLHVVFGDSAGGSLREALRSVGRNDLVVALEDDLSVGPINPAEPRQRAAWVERELGHKAGKCWIEDAEAFWSDALRPEERRIVWTSRRSAPDYAGFLEWLWRIGDAPCEVLDSSEFSFTRTSIDGVQTSSGMIIAPAVLDPGEIVAMRLFDRSEPLSPATRSEHRQAWARLRAENAPLRLLSEAGFRSSALSAFDDDLLAQAGPTWRKVARLVGSVMVADECLHRVGEALLLARIRALVDSARLESRGDLRKMRFSEVRLPAGEA